MLNRCPLSFSSLVQRRRSFPIQFYSPTRLNTHSIAAKVENDFCTISIYWNDETSDHIRFRCWQKKGLNEMKQKCFVQLAHFRSSPCHGRKRFRVMPYALRGASINQKITDFRLQHLLLYHFIVANFLCVV